MLIDIAQNYDTDKTLHEPHLVRYERFFLPLREKDIRLLELGIYKGGSLQMWRDYFPNGVIAGLDYSPVSIPDPSGKIHIYQGLQQDTTLLDRIGQECAPDGFDIIIDDCSHIAEYTRPGFWHLFDRWLKPDGIFAIEDWGTGYWDTWQDGKNMPRPSDPTEKLTLLKRGLRRLSRLLYTPPVEPKPRYPSHDYGMVGFVKELVDEVGMPDISGPGWGMEPFVPSKFASMEISHGLVVIVKRR